jgi:hypothetical protein
MVGLPQFCVAVIFTDEHAQSMNGIPVAIVRGCTVARDQRELARLLCPGAEPVAVQLYAEPDTTQAEMCALWMAGFRIRLVRASEVFAVPGWWHLAAHRHHSAMTRTIQGPRSSKGNAGQGTGPGQTTPTNSAPGNRVGGSLVASKPPLTSPSTAHE